jgi:hypothetical protein
MVKVAVVVNIPGVAVLGKFAFTKAALKVRLSE